ncbi:uncharacterized protein LOC109723358 [Ananas comosus]|uniref:Uncharacterized protein LOC109723358 n=1 Tax=Ananas comosus TaxID=4615 RepID=A0A6P5GH55_ANACO|nr:uncharacterized protein LOC109723358 [Ananas comosus]
MRGINYMQAAKKYCLQMLHQSMWAVYKTHNSEPSHKIHGAVATVSVHNIPDIKHGQVNPDLYGDNQTRLFTLWTVDGYKNTGCYNLLCEGFVFTGKSNFGPGSVLEPVSVYEGVLHNITLKISQDPQSRDWWLHCRHDGYNDDSNLEQMGY